MVTYAPIACKHKVSGSFSLPSRGPFHLSLTVLFSIGHLVVFRLGGWAPRLQTGFHVSGPTLVSAVRFRLSRTGLLPPLVGLSRPVPLDFRVTSCRSATPVPVRTGLASFPFARRYLGNHFCFLFLRVLRCFSSPRSPLMTYVFSHGYVRITAREFPHSDICGSQDMCSLPQLIAACHVLLRLQVPRHSPYALCHLTLVA